VDAGAVGVLVDDAEQGGLLSEREGDSLTLADAVFSGVGHADREAAHTWSRRFR